jgi:septal ring-binding cell division protein DamX
MEAYSDTTGKSYPSFDALIEAESNGYLATAILTNGKKYWTWTVGPFPSKREANNAKGRLKTSLNREADRYPFTQVLGYTVRPAWKEV